MFGYIEWGMSIPLLVNYLEWGMPVPGLGTVVLLVAHCHKHRKRCYVHNFWWIAIEPQQEMCGTYFRAVWVKKISSVIHPCTYTGILYSLTILIKVKK